MKYDYAILGGGAAGLSLALALVHSPLKDHSILIVDKQAKNTNDRTWCFWTDRASSYDSIAYHTWPKLRFVSENFDRTSNLAPFRYQMLRGIDFYEHARAELKKHNVNFLLGAGEVQDGLDSARVIVDGMVHEAGWVFDSRFTPENLPGNQRRYSHLKQHFTGWIIETDNPIFDPQTVTLFDLRTPQRGGVTFFYVLPFSENRALVEYTLFSPDLLAEEDYVRALKDYISNTLGIKNTIIESVERGIIPMTDHPFKRRLGKRVLSIGTLAGRVKPSTGFAFARIQRDSEQVVHSLLKNGHPFGIPPDRLRSRLNDSILLEVLSREPERGREIFTALFARNPAVRVLKFLDDRSSVLEDLQILAAPDPAPFARAVIKILGKSLLSR
jgi:lycopene beta-cyclase